MTVREVQISAEAVISDCARGADVSVNLDLESNVDIAVVFGIWLDMDVSVNLRTGGRKTQRGLGGGGHRCMHGRSRVVVGWGGGGGWAGESDACTCSP